MKILKNLLLAALVTTSVVSCKDDELESFSLLPGEGKTVSAGDIDLTSIVKDNELIRIPVKIALSGPADKAFQVVISPNVDTVNTLIANNTLPNTVALPTGAIEYPNVINVEYGADTATVILGFKVTPLERSFGKKVAAAFKLSEPGKGNRISPSKSSILIVFDTKDVINAADLHYISIAKNGGSVLNVRRGEHYTITSAGITIPLNVDLAGVPGRTFSVKTTTNADTINHMINNGLLPPNSELLPADKFEVDSVVTFGSNKSSGPLSVTIPWAVFDANISANKNLAFAVKLSEPTRHVLHPQNSTVIVVLEPSVNLDNNSFIEGNGTGLRGEYFRLTKTGPDDPTLVPDMIRIDPQINFNWDGGNPFNSPGDITFSIRWKGEFLAPVRGEYIFYQTRWDDGCRLIVNGQVIIDEFNDRWDQPTRVGRITLERGQRYTIEAHHRENFGGANAFLEYEVPGLIRKQVVPRSQLFPAQ